MDNLANSATFSWKMKTSWCDQEEGSSPIGLNLELGRSSDHKLDYKNRSRFTFLQIQELHLQVLIYKYLEAGLPIPHHLLLPIWQSFSTSLGTLKDLGGGALCLDSRKDLDPEPCRCRRTDGKKWRCGKEALPNQKYCGRHMHRGRHRSRKLVDTANNVASGRSCSSTNSTSNKSDFGEVEVVGSNTELSISLPRLDR